MKIYKADGRIGNGRTIGVKKNRQNKPEEPHCHDFIEIVYVMSGGATQRVDEACYEVERGDIVFINYGSRHSFEPHDDFEYVNIYFMPEVLGSSIITSDNALALLSLTAFDEMRKDKNGGKLSFFGDERREVEFIISNMLREYAGDQPEGDRVVENYLSILFTKMLRKTLLNESGTQIKDIWDELREYIDENLHEELTLSALAKKSFYNPSYFSRIFKQRFGSSLSDYVRAKRIEHAMTLLSETELSVDEIIERIGYADRSAFYHAFSKMASMTPAEYRVQNKVK